MKSEKIPDSIVGRLSIYLSALQRMTEKGTNIIGTDGKPVLNSLEQTFKRSILSKELGQHLGISAVQIRKDLSQFGEFGKQGAGYSITGLTKGLEEILKVDRQWDMIIVGAGDMGHSLARYQGFSDRGFNVVRIFDNDKNKVVQKVGSLSIEDISDLPERVKSAGIKIALLAIPALVAQDTTNLLVEAGIKAILSYTPISLDVPNDVKVQYIDPVIHLQRMTFYL